MLAQPNVLQRKILLVNRANRNCETRMSNQVALVVDHNWSVIEEAVMEAEKAGLHLIGMKSTEEVLDFLWEQSLEVDLVLAKPSSPQDFEELRMIADDWESLKILVISDRNEAPAGLPTRIKYVTRPTSGHELVSSILAA